MVVAEPDGEPIEGFEELSEDMVVCEDDNGRYRTFKNRLDSGMADPLRWDRLDARKATEKREKKDEKKKD